MLKKRNGLGGGKREKKRSKKGTPRKRKGGTFCIGGSLRSSMREKKMMRKEKTWNRPGAKKAKKYRGLLEKGNFCAEQGGGRRVGGRAEGQGKEDHLQGGGHEQKEDSSWTAHRRDESRKPKKGLSKEKKAVIGIQDPHESLALPAERLHGR